MGGKWVTGVIFSDNFQLLGPLPALSNMILSALSSGDPPIYS